jgi:hypothetical protein
LIRYWVEHSAGFNWPLQKGALSALQTDVDHL